MVNLGTCCVRLTVRTLQVRQPPSPAHLSLSPLAGPLAPAHPSRRDPISTHVAPGVCAAQLGPAAGEEPCALTPRKPGPCCHPHRPPPAPADSRAPGDPRQCPEQAAAPGGPAAPHPGRRAPPPPWPHPRPSGSPAHFLLPKNQRVMQQLSTFRWICPLFQVLSLEEGFSPPVQERRRQAPVDPAAAGRVLGLGVLGTSRSWREAALSSGEGAAGTAGAAVTAQACFTEILEACSEDGVG